MIKHNKIKFYAYIAILLFYCKPTENLTEEQLKNAIVYVAYSDATPKDIYLIEAKPDAKPIRITYDYSWEESPSWTNNGYLIVFNKSDGPLTSNSKWFLHSIDLPRRKDKKITAVSMAAEVRSSSNIYFLDDDALFCLNGKSIKKLFDVKDLPFSSKITGDIWSFSVDKSEEKFVLVFTDGVRTLELPMSIASKFMELAMVNIDGTNFQILTNDTFPDFAPAISPDGKFIAYESTREQNRDIFIMEIETKEVRRLTTHPADDYSPTWSPDGNKIAFISGRDGHSHIYVINADGTGLFQLTKGDFNVWPGISWSPR